jgi:hypothetical protein
MESMLWFNITSWSYSNLRPTHTHLECRPCKAAGHRHSKAGHRTEAHKGWGEGDLLCRKSHLGTKCTFAGESEATPGIQRVAYRSWEAIPHLGPRSYLVTYNLVLSILLLNIWKHNRIWNMQVGRDSLDSIQPWSGHPYNRRFPIKWRP